jgi:succinate dehydrogenase/fumarate reductase cytochrome b subunit
MEPPPAPTARRRVRWGAIAGVAVLAYVVVLSVALVGLDHRTRFNRWSEVFDSLGARLVLCLVVLAALFHTLDGIRRLVVEFAPSTVRHDVRMRTGVLFLTWALVIPAGVMIVGPWVTETFR